MTASTRNALLLWLTLAIGVRAEPVQILIVPFQGQEPLGRNVSNVLYLQTWQTLRKAPTPNPAHLDFGTAVALWASDDLRVTSHEQAEAAARQTEAQVVLWGKTWPFSTQAIVQTYLTVVEGVPALWSVTLQGRGGPRVVTCPLPSRRFEFAPIPLSAEVVRLYAGEPSGLPYYRLRDTSQAPVGHLGEDFVAVEHTSSEWTKVRVDGGVGWVNLPVLTKSRSEVVDFAGAVVRALRRDWQGAADLFLSAARNPRTPTTVAIDAHLMRAASLAALGKSPDEDLDAAEALNPRAPRTSVYRLMGLLDRYQKLGRGADAAEARRRLVERIDQALGRTGAGLSSSDPWLESARRAVAELPEHRLF
jgi:hypothetical protein